MPSLGEAPSGGAKRFLVTFLGVCKKVTRCKSGTHSSRYRSNGYALTLPKHPTGSEQHKKLRRHLWPSQASQLPHLIGFSPQQFSRRSQYLAPDQ